MVKSFNIKSFKANGNLFNDVIATFEKAKKFVEEKKLPIFLEFQTYRWFEHCGPNIDDHLNYRNKKELLYWKKNDPINILQDFLIKKNLMSNNSINIMKNSILKKIDSAFQYAKKSPFPKNKDLLKYLYK